MECCKCGKEMTDTNGDSLIGLKILVESGELKTAFVQSQLGKYEIGKEYLLCFECLFKVHGIPGPRE